MIPETKEYKVLVVDDSSFMRRLIVDILDQHPQLKVVGTAFNGKMALNMIRDLNPDVMTLDVEMPIMGGLETLIELKKIRPLPVVMFSSLTAKGAEVTIQALELGAFDFAQKPEVNTEIKMEVIKDNLISKVLSAAQNFKKESFEEKKFITRIKSAKVPEKTNKIVVIGSSTGGPQALKAVIPCLPKEFPASILVVQHMPAKFTEMFAQRLDSLSELTVLEAKEGDLPEPGKVYLAPGNYHMSLDEDKIIRLNQDPPLWGLRPAVDITLESAVKLYKEEVVCVILTGMGHDGRDGAKAVRQHGGYCIAEHESTCVVYGMPKSVIDAGQANAVAPIDQIPDEIIRAISMSN